MAVAVADTVVPVTSPPSTSNDATEALETEDCKAPLMDTLPAPSDRTPLLSPAKTSAAEPPVDGKGPTWRTGKKPGGAASALPVARAASPLKLAGELKASSASATFSFSKASSGPARHPLVPIKRMLPNAHRQRFTNAFMDGLLSWTFVHERIDKGRPRRRARRCHRRSKLRIRGKARQQSFPEIKPHGEVIASRILR
ncbi:Hypothetical protein A7982_01506 [Minicystis rosea]|nr:Hypothetical protein A7982_01506 [Minicystis rosea]